MKNLLIIAVAASLTACNGDPGHLSSKGAGPRTPTIEEAAGRRMKVEMRYDPAIAPSPTWVAWRGTALLELEGPQAGIDYLPATLTPVSGFEDLDPDCLSDRMSGEWALEPDGTFGVFLEPTAIDGSSLEFFGKLSLNPFVPGSSGWGGDDGRVDRLVASGEWEVSLGFVCDADDFSGGTEGLFDALEDEAAPTEPEPEELIEPNATVVLIDEHGHSVRVTGPAAVVLRARAAARVR